MLHLSLSSLDEFFRRVPRSLMRQRPAKSIPTISGVFLALFLAVLLPCSWGGETQPAPVQEYDLVVYGPTSAGVMAAVEAKRLGKVLVSSER